VFYNDLMIARISGLAVSVLVVLSVASADAGFGSPAVIAHSVRLPAARQNPGATLTRFMDAPSNDQERLVLFMLVVTLGEENRINKEEFSAVIQRGLMDVHDSIRGHALHALHHVFDGVELQNQYRRCTLDTSHHVRYNAAELLVKFPSAATLPYLDALLSDESIEVRDRAAGTLCAWHRAGSPPDVFDLFVRAQESKDIRRAGCAARILATQSKKQARPALLNAYLVSELEKPQQSPTVFGADNISAIIRLLAEIGDPSSKSPWNRPPDIPIGMSRLRHKKRCERSLVTE
jgi:hypothetical protein